MPFHNITDKEYRSIQAVNISSLKELMKSPEEYYASTFDSEPTPAQRFGTLWHLIVLEPNLFDSNYAITPTINKRTNTGKLAYQEFLLKNANKTVITEADYQRASKMAEQFNYEKNFQNLARSAVKTEQPITFTYRDVLCKAKIDLVSNYNERHSLVDIKTTNNVYNFKTQIRAYKYHYQMAFYYIGLRSLGLDCQDFYLVAQAKSYPYKIITYKLDNEVIQKTIPRIDELLDLYKYFVEIGKWNSVMLEEVTAADLFLN